MALTPSNMLPLGTTAPDFELIDTISGEKYKLRNDKTSKATVVMFICNHCKYVKHINAQIVQIVDKFSPKGVQFIGISSNDPEAYPEDSPENMKIRAKELGYQFPYLFDETQEVARAFEAACTPEFYVFDEQLKLVYRGRMDASTPGNNEPNNGAELRGALRAILAGDFVSEIQYPGMGCNIKWKQS